LAVGLANGWGDISESFDWAPGRFLIALAVTFAGLTAVALSWAVLHSGEERARAFRSYLLVQPAKHVPGGVAHPLSLISASSRDGSVAGSTTLFLRYSLLLVSGGLVHGLLLLFSWDQTLVAVGAVAAGVGAGAVAFSSRLAGRVEDWIPRIMKRFGKTDRTTETGRPVSAVQVLGAWLWATLGIAGLAGGFAVLASSFEGMPAPVVLAGAFGVSWAIGYLLVPFPAGLGVRETALLVFLGSTVGAGPVIAASLLQRVCQMAAELLGVLLGGFLGARERRHSRSTPNPVTPDP
ncbi:MAG TPA: hypothetical protein VFY54_04585, partial [Rubrobacter sp.]|nr:hypothetical protein [Rubrobacter sp.]